MGLEQMIAAAARFEQNKNKKEKEYLYLGYYYDDKGRFILKIGTTNNLKRRQGEHNRKYRQSNGEAKMPQENSFNYIWSLKLSGPNTRIYEDLNKTLWKDLGFGQYLDNDRFIFEEKPDLAIIKIKKYYEISLKGLTN